jgi:hypothetical protein
MIVCDYVSDLGTIFKGVVPSIRGLNIRENEAIDLQDVLLIASNFIPVEDYEQVPNRSGVCSVRFRKRLILLQLDNQILELEYPRPFKNIDWRVLEQSNVKAQIFPEFINDGQVRLQLKDYNPYG